MTIHDALDILSIRFESRVARIAWNYLTGLDLDALDLESPLVVGCLLALLREASGDPRARVSPYLLGSQGYHVEGRGLLIDLVIDAPSEGEAIAAALVALAGVL